MTVRNTATIPEAHKDLEVVDVDKDIPDINRPSIMKMQIEGTVHQFAGVLLGDASSQSGEHRDHPIVTDPETGERTMAKYAPKGTKCSACRWLEVEIYRKLPDPNNEYDTIPIYVVVTRGPSIVPTERDYEKITYTESPLVVAEVLTVRKTRGDQNTFLPPQHALALAQAAAYDAGLKEAYLAVS